MDVPLEPLTTAQEDGVLDDVGYSRKKLSEDLASVRSWVSEQKHFPSSAKSEPDAFFCNFLVGCKGDIKKAKGKIDNYYRFRSRAKDFYSERDPLAPAFAATWPYFQLLTLPKPTQDGSRLLMTLSGIPDFPGYDPVLIIKRILVILDMRLRSEKVQGGEYIIMDNKNYSLSYFLAVRPTFMRNVIHFIQAFLEFVTGSRSNDTTTSLKVTSKGTLRNVCLSKFEGRVSALILEKVQLLEGNCLLLSVGSVANGECETAVDTLYTQTHVHYGCGQDSKTEEEEGNVMPWRIRGVISLNTPAFMHVAINRLIKPMMKTKIARRWHVYTEGSEVLTNHFPSEILPKDQGGGEDTLQEISDRWMEYASSTHWREWLLKEGSETVEEDERQGLLPFTGLWG